MDKYFYKITRNFREPSDPDDYTTFTIEKRLTNDLKVCFDKVLAFKEHHKESHFVMEGGRTIFHDEPLLSEYGDVVIVKSGFTIVEEKSDKEWYEFEFAVIEQEYN